MSILRAIIPFYGVIEGVIQSIGGVVQEDQKRRTMRTEAELRVYMQTQYEKEMSNIRSNEHREKAEVEVYVQTEIERRKAATKNRLEEEQHKRQIEFEKHRTQMFEDIKRLEIEIHQQVTEYDIAKQKEIAEWHRNFNRSLENELFEVMETKVSFLVEKSLAFEKIPQVYEKYVERIFTLADHLTESIKKDQEYFRDILRDLSKRPQQLTSSLLELNQRMRISETEVKKLRD